MLRLPDVGVNPKTVLIMKSGGTAIQAWTAEQAHSRLERPVTCSARHSIR